MKGGLLPVRLFLLSPTWQTKKEGDGVQDEVAPSGTRYMRW